MTAERMTQGVRLREGEREVLHAEHAVRINPSHIGCPLCATLAPVVERIVAARVGEVARCHHVEGEPSTYCNECVRFGAKIGARAALRAADAPTSKEGS